MKQIDEHYYNLLTFYSIAMSGSSQFKFIITGTTDVRTWGVFSMDIVVADEISEFLGNI